MRKNLKVKLRPRSRPKGLYYVIFNGESHVGIRIEMFKKRDYLFGRSSYHSLSLTAINTNEIKDVQRDMDNFTLLYTFIRDFLIELHLFQSFQQGVVRPDHCSPRHLRSF